MPQHLLPGYELINFLPFAVFHSFLDTLLRSHYFYCLSSFVPVLISQESGSGLF